MQKKIATTPKMFSLLLLRAAGRMLKEHATSKICKYKGEEQVSQGTEEWWVRRKAQDYGGNEGSHAEIVWHEN